MDTEEVILVNEWDHPIGTMGKLEAHRLGSLHRAFSVFVFNDEDELLVHRRADGKYHSTGLWTNTCCSHPRPGEKIMNAAHRRLREEMGFDCPLINAFQFKYKADVGNGLVEHEHDHVFIGQFNGEPCPNQNEVSEWKFVSMDDLKLKLKNQSEDFTSWFRIALPVVEEWITIN